MNVDSFVIRVAEPSDATEAARLFTQLGHTMSCEQVAERWQKFSTAGNTAFVVDRNDGSLAGVLTTSCTAVLHRTELVGRITTMIIDEPDRGRGLGRRLVESAEAHLLRLGCGLLEITSNDRLSDAHAFYGRLGYERTSIRFVKRLC